MPKKQPLYPHIPKSRKKSTPDTKYLARLDPALATRSSEQEVFETADEAIAHAESLKEKMLPGDVVHVREGIGFDFNVIYRYKMPLPADNPTEPKAPGETEQEIEVRLWTGTRIPVSDREEAVRVIKRELEGWKQEGDRIVWYNKEETDLVPSIAYVMDSVGELTDASAIIVSKR